MHHEVAFTGPSVLFAGHPFADSPSEPATYLTHLPFNNLYKNPNLAMILSLIPHFISN